MYIPRIYSHKLIQKKKIIKLKKKNVHYCRNVIKLKIGDIIHVFNNTNNIFISKILDINKKNVFIKIMKQKKDNKESFINIHLGQLISKKINITIEKAVELGVVSITPIIKEKKSFLEKNNHYILKKMNYWKNIIIAACAQSQRNILPQLNFPATFFQWCDCIPKKSTKIIFNLHAKKNIYNVSNKHKNIYILIGSEMGFSKKEVDYATKKKFLNISLGPRRLRSETAGIVAITALQIFLGDMK